MKRPRALVSRPDATGGFTLLETIVVLLILGLALSITAGFLLRPNTTATLANASTRIASEMRLARMRAMTQSRPVLLTLTKDGHGLRLDDDIVTLGLAPTLVMVGPDSIIFAPDGSTSGGAVSVTVGTKKRLIRADWLTGRVSQSGAP